MATRFAAVGRKLMVGYAGAACDRCVFAARQLFALSAGERFPPWDSARGAPDGIIVLGGSIDPDLSAAHGTPCARRGRPHRRRRGAGASLSECAHRLFRRQREPDFERRAGRPTTPRRCSKASALRRARLIMERRSRNTWRTPNSPRRWPRRKPGERWLLVTSAFHMPRSIGLFRKAGFAVEAYPVDWRVGGRDDLFNFSIFAIDGLARTDLARARMDRACRLPHHRQDRRVASRAAAK